MFKVLLTLFAIAFSVAADASRPRTTNSCGLIDSYYWEIGDRNGVLSYGSVVGASGKLYAANDPIELASASKWVYGAYIAQTRPVQEFDAKFLNMRSGYKDFTSCTRLQTVGACSTSGTNGVYTPSADGKFYYGGGHMQQHAVSADLGAKTAGTLGAAVTTALGVEVVYNTPQLAGGAMMTPAAYGALLRKMMRGELAIGAVLGTRAVCTNPATCPSALSAPIPQSESWHYSLGHWVEDDPNVGDGAFSSPGAFGFYPWISADKKFYGIVARKAFGGSWSSVKCGRELRKAWMAKR